MRNNEANIFMFIASVIIGILVAMNLSITRENKRLFLTSKEYHDAYAYRNKLLNDMSNLSDQYIMYSNKLKKYVCNVKNVEKIEEEILREIDENNDILGYSRLKGPGIKITLVDIGEEFTEDFIERQLKLIHNTDMIQVINDIKNAGAEAISINGLRVIDNSFIICNGAFLRVNGIQIRGPFYINAIGNKEALKNYMLSDEGYLKSLMLRGIEVNVQCENNVIISAYNGKMKNQYVKPIKQ